MCECVSVCALPDRVRTVGVMCFDNLGCSYFGTVSLMGDLMSPDS